MGFALDPKVGQGDLRLAPGFSLRHFGCSGSRSPFFREFSLWSRRPWTDTMRSARRRRLRVGFRDVVVHHFSVIAYFQPSAVF